jgi:hypothetical protein
MPYGEVFEWCPPSLSFHGLIMGSPYMEIEGTAHLRDVKRPLEKYAECRFYKRGWTQGSHHHIEADVYSAKGVIAFKIAGKWSDEVTITDMRRPKSEQRPEVVFKKLPYPENWQY